MAYQWHYVAQVAAGAYAKGFSPSGNVCDLTTYSPLETLLAEKGPDIQPGAWIVDARAVPEDAQISEAIGGPMPLQGLDKDEGTGALDYVTCATKARRWAALGARVGLWDGTRVLWQAAPVGG